MFNELINAFNGLDALQKLLAILGVFGAVPLLYGAVQWVRAVEWPIRWRKLPNPSTAERLLKYVWDYPTLGESEASWAVKESAAILGRVGSAREHPGFGVAIITTELALLAFGSAAESRINRCVSWAIARTERAPPYYVRAEILHEGPYISESRPDLRHTLALGVVLKRAQRASDYADAYVNLALSTRDPDLGWPSEHSITISRVLTALYAVELLHLAVIQSAHQQTEQLQIRRAEGLRWLMEHREPDGLWSSGGLKDHPWDRVLTTAWIVHRLAPMSNLPVEGWRQTLDEAICALTRAAIEPGLWEGVDDLRRRRVEARVAAAARRALNVPEASQRTQEAAQLYLAGWVERTKDWLDSTAIDSLDLSTVAFLVSALVPEKDLPALGAAVLGPQAISKPLSG